MGRIGTFVIGAVVGAVLIFGAQRYHLLRADDGFYVVPKLSATFEQAYVDVREFGVTDWVEHRELAAAIVKAKKDHLFQDSAADSFRDGLKNALDSISPSAG